MVGDENAPRRPAPFHAGSIGCHVGDLWGTPRPRRAYCSLESVEVAMQAKWTIAVAAAAGLVLICGCHVSSNKHGDSDNVKIATPFGGLQVKTNDAAVLE